MLTQQSVQAPLSPKTTSSERQPSSTSDFGIQVDLANPQSLVPHHQNKQEASERRKQLKKQAKKRKREKEQQLQREARRQIGNIVQQIYEGKSCFEDYAGQIEELVEVVYKHDFRDFMDQLIRMRVTCLQKSIWEYTQSILDDNPFENNSDHAFYILIVEHLHRCYLQLEQSSFQVEKIINLYLKFTYQDQQQEEIVYSNLAGNTFNYLVDTDHTLKNLIRICQQKVPPTRPAHHQKLAQLISILDNYPPEHYDEDSEQICLDHSDDHLSTAISEEDDSLERKKRKRKVKEGDIVTTEETLCRRLESLVVGQERGPCRVEEEWLEGIRRRRQQYRTAVIHN